jgi:hypothetical protein
VSELTERIKVNSSSAASSSNDDEEGGDTQFVQFFPNFVWAVRDFTLLLEIDGRNVTEDEYLEHSLELRKGDISTSHRPNDQLCTISLHRIVHH